MLTERPPIQNVSPISVSLGLNVLFEKTDISALLQKLAMAEFSSNRLQTPMWEIAPEDPMLPSESIQTSTQQQVESGPYPESDYHWLTEVLETLTDIASRNANNSFATLIEVDYERLDAVLKELIYIVGDDEKHRLASLMDFIGVLTARYESEHFPKLTDLFPELTEDADPNNTKNEDRHDNLTKELKKPTNILAAEAFFSIGNLLSEGNKKEGAIFAYDQAIYLNPEHAYSYYNRGRAKGSLGQYESEIVDLDETLRLIPDFAEAYLLRGIAKVAMNHHESAVADFDETLRLNPDNSLVYIVYASRGCAKVMLNRHETAIEDFDKGICLNPDSAEAYLLRGYAKYGIGEYEAAIEDFDHTIRLEPEHAAAYNNRGHLKNKLGQYKSALSDCNESIRLNFDDAWPYANRGFAKIKLGQIASALTDCDEAVQRDPSLAEAYHTRGEANALLGRTPEAKADLQKALELAEQTDNQDLKTEIAQSLQKLDNAE